MRRLSSSLVALAAVSLACAQTGLPAVPELKPTLSYAGRAERIPALFKNLAPLVGVSLEANPAFENEVVLVSGQNLSTEATLLKIAQVTAGRWERTQTGLRLVVDQNVRGAQEKAALAERLKSLRLNLQRQVEPPKPPRGAEDEEDAAMEAGDPSPQPTARILLAMDLIPIARLRPGERLVYASRPNGLQRALPPSAAEHIAAYVRQHNETAKAMGGTGATEDMPPEMMMAMPPHVKEMMARQGRPITDVARTLLVVSRSGAMDMTNASLRLYDAQGMLVGQDQTFLDFSFGDFSQLNNTETAAQPGTTPPPGKGTPVVYGEDTLLFQKAMPQVRMASTATPAGPPDPKLVRLASVDLIDPLSLAVTDELLAVAQKAGKPIVANLSDASLTLMGAIFSGGNGSTVEEVDASNMPVSGSTPARGGKGRTVEEVEASLKEGGPHQLLADDAFVLVSPRDPIGARERRADRRSLARLLKAAGENNGVVPLAETAAFAAQNPAISFMDGAALYLGMFAPGAFSTSLGGLPNWSMLRLYHGIGATEGSRLEQGASVPARSFDGRSLGEMVYGADARLRVDRGQKEEPFDLFSNAMYIGMSSMGGLDAKDEPTEALPGGVPGDAFVTVAVRREPFVMMRQGSFSAPVGPDEIALIRMFMENKEAAAAMAQFMPSLTALPRGERSVYEFTFHLAPGLSIKETLYDHRLAGTPTTVNFKELPPDFQKIVDERLAKLKKSPFAAMMAGMGSFMKGSTPPP